MMTDDVLQSKTIAFLRFPLIVGVVLIHSTFGKLMVGGEMQVETGTYPVYETASYFLSQILSRIAVPLFFFFSGFLFFFKTEGFTSKVYWSKIKKRARTILLPFLIWNLVVIGFYFCAQTFVPDLMSGRNKPVCEYNWSDWLWAFWDTSRISPAIDGTMPTNYPLWFIRDLMIVILFSPLLYLLMKKLKHYFVLLLGVLWLVGWWVDWVGFSLDAFFFFSAGAYFGIYKKNFVQPMKSYLWGLTFVYLVIAGVELGFRGEPWMPYWHKAGILIGMAFAISLCARFIENESWKASPFLAGSSFFIYAYHALPLSFVIKVLFKLFHPHSDMALIGAYLLCPAITILIGLGIYALLQRFLPRFTAIITGGR